MMWVFYFVRRKYKISELECHRYCFVVLVPEASKRQGIHREVEPRSLRGEGGARAEYLYAMVPGFDIQRGYCSYWNGD